jgi:hypothetical protein
MHYRIGLGLLLGFLVGVPVVPQASPPGAISNSQLDLASVVAQARTKPHHPRKSPPKWMDYAQVEAGYGFLAKHRGAIMRVLGTSSLAATFAAKDVTPVLMDTGRLPKDFSPRMRETGEWMDTIFARPDGKEGFVANNYARAVALGRMHAMVAESTGPNLKWDPKERVPLNQQSYAFVLYSFVWWPVEAQIARGVVDPVEDRKELDAWFHLWSVIGYGMGVSEDLLPRDYTRAAALVPLLRQAQYAAPGEKLPEGIPILLGGHVRMLTERTAAQFAPKSEGGAKPKANATLMYPMVAKGFADTLRLSPGLLEALGLGKDATKQLTRYAAAPPP